MGELVPANFRLSPGQVRYILEDSRPAILFYGAQLAEVATAAGADALVARQVVIGGDDEYEPFLTAGQPDEGAEVDPDDVCLVMYTWLPGAFPLALVAGRLLSPRPAFGPALEDFLVLGALVLLAVVVVCWLVTDARSAFALCLAVLLWIVTATLPQLAYGGYLYAPLKAGLVQFAVVLPVLLAAAWLLLRRQEAPGPRPDPGP